MKQRGLALSGLVLVVSGACSSTPPARPGEPDDAARWHGTTQYWNNPRRRADLITELSGLERLYVRTTEESAKPGIMLRLALGYIELEAAAGVDRSRTSNPESARMAAIIESKARENALKYFELLEQTAPSYVVDQALTKKLLLERQRSAPPRP